MFNCGACVSGTRPPVPPSNKAATRIMLTAEAVSISLLMALVVPMGAGRVSPAIPARKN